MANIKNREAALKLGQTNTKCARCGKTVYFAEQVFGAGKKWHKQCFKCVECNKTVSSTSLRDKDGKKESLFHDQGSRDGRSGESTRLPPMWLGFGIIQTVCLLLVLVLALRGFSLGNLIVPSPQKPTLLNSKLIWKVSLISALC